MDSLTIKIPLKFWKLIACCLATVGCSPPIPTPPTNDLLLHKASSILAECGFGEPVHSKTNPPYEWVYWTSLRNNSDKPITIFKVELLTWDGRIWKTDPDTLRILDTNEFHKVSVMNPVIEEGSRGVIPPRGSAEIKRNWHKSKHKESPHVKWVFWGKDPTGAEHYAEVLVDTQSHHRE